MVAECLHHAFIIEAQHLEKTGGQPDKSSDDIVLVLEEFLVMQMTKMSHEFFFFGGAPREWRGRLKRLVELIRVKPDSHETYFKRLMDEYDYLALKVGPDLAFRAKLTLWGLSPAEPVVIVD